MIDKLEIRVPRDTAFHPAFNRLYREIRYPDADPFHRSRYYEAVADLRPYGYDAMLHLWCRWGKDGNHKLELVDTGRMTYAGMVNEIERIFQTDALQREVMRVDLAADAEGIPVSWFQERIKARYKQCIARLGYAEFMEMGKGGIQTLYYGRRPNLFRIYDKLAEYRQQYQKQFRNISADLPRPTLEEVFGVPSTISVLTRVERQIAGGKVPQGLETVADLRTASDFRPFDPLAIVTGGTAEPNPDEFSFQDYCTGMYLRHRAERDGMHALMHFITRYSKRNTKWALNKFRAFLPAQGEEGAVTADYLNGLFRQSMSRQLAA